MLDPIEIKRLFSVFAHVMIVLLLFLAELFKVLFILEHLDIISHQKAPKALARYASATMSPMTVTRISPGFTPGLLRSIKYSLLMSLFFMLIPPAVDVSLNHVL
tara:strand:+ start:1344 stop:1655 length:312 start_codon:yes stop_codon:yes gene_type:complete